MQLFQIPATQKMPEYGFRFNAQSPLQEFETGNSATIRYVTGSAISL